MHLNNYFIYKSNFFTNNIYPFLLTGHPTYVPLVFMSAITVLPAPMIQSLQIVRLLTIELPTPIQVAFPIYTVPAICAPGDI